jgi:hypothetical protein
MFKWLRRRRLSPEGRKRLLLVSARAEEAIVETHVANLIHLLEALDDEVDLDRGLEIYVEMMQLDESRANTVTSRLLARLENADDRGGSARPFRNIFRTAGHG